MRCIIFWPKREKGTYKEHHGNHDFEIKDFSRQFSSGMKLKSCFGTISIWRALQCLTSLSDFTTKVAPAPFFKKKRQIFTRSGNAKRNKTIYPPEYMWWQGRILLSQSFWFQIIINIYKWSLIVSWMKANFLLKPTGLILLHRKILSWSVSFALLLWVLRVKSLEKQ